MTGNPTAGRPPSAPEGGRPRRVRRLTAAAVVAGLSLAAAGTTALITDRSRPVAHIDIGALPAPGAAGAQHLPGRNAPAARPVRIRIPGIGVDRSLADLGVQSDGHLAAPEDPEQVGWWSDGPRPGDAGAAVIVGHVDSLTGPAAFYGISALRPGDSITVDRADHSHLDFTVQALRQYKKDDFPDNEVYATTGPPELRLITCGGPYDPAEGGYLDNVVVYATLAAPSPPHSSPSPPHTPPRSGN
ncbi:class F sortase [Streptomyces sp. NBC_01198]|uniref:class F sortase n=1 Tax=Streptomyces sp. NBC_01198 TaxID=2903769 RepID=UPI002E11CE56|nr:class F sortase [Streptomyces sp. NBC_01198]